MRVRVRGERSPWMSPDAEQGFGNFHEDAEHCQLREKYMVCPGVKPEKACLSQHVGSNQPERAVIHVYLRKQMRQPFVGPGIVAVHAVRVDALYVAKLADVFASGIYNADARRGFLHDADKTPKHGSRKVVIVCGPFEEGASGKFKRPIMICA